MKTNWQDPGAGEICSTQITGLQDAVVKLEDAVNLGTVAETAVPLTPVTAYAADGITAELRIFQVAAGHRNWLAAPAPVIYKNSSAISSGFTIDYGGGAILLDPVALETDVFTADFTRTNSTPVLNYAGATTNTGNAYAITKPVISELVEGMEVTIKVNADSTGAVTLNWCGTGDKAILRAGGSAVANLKTGGIYTLRYSGVNFILQGSTGAGDATPGDLLSGKTAESDAGPITGTLALTGDAGVADVLAGKKFYRDDPLTQLVGTLAAGSGGSPISSIQHGTITIAASTKTATATITQVDPDRSLLVFLGHNVSGTGSADSYGAVRVELLDSATVQANVYANNTQPVTINFCVVEFATGIVKSKQAGTISTAAETTATTTITAVDISKTILVGLGFTTTSTLNSNNCSYIKLGFDDHATIRGSVGIMGTLVMGWNLIEFN